LPAEFKHDAYAMSTEERVAKGIAVLPPNLGSAIDLFEQSDLMREVLGDHIHGFFVRNKREEWDAYCADVSQWELDRYLAVL